MPMYDIGRRRSILNTRRVLIVCMALGLIIGVQMLLTRKISSGGYSMQTNISDMIPREGGLYWTFFRSSAPPLSFGSRFRNLFELLMDEGHALTLYTQSDGDSVALNRVPVRSFHHHEKEADVAVFILEEETLDWAWISKCIDALKAKHTGTRIMILSDVSHWHSAFLTDTGWESVRDSARKLFEKADMILALSVNEQILHQQLVPNIPVALVGFGSEVNEGKPFHSRKDLLFSCGDSEACIKSQKWLTSNIWPILKQEIGMENVVLNVVGQDCEPGFDVRCHVEITRELVENARVFMNPVTYGSIFVPQSIVALSRGLPIVTTTAGARGILLGSTDMAVVCSEWDTDMFAKHTASIYNSEDTWNKARRLGLVHTQQFHSRQVLKNQIHLIIKPPVYSSTRNRVFLAAIFHNNEDIIPSFVMNLLHLIDILGRDQVFVSVYESGSSDGSPEHLLALKAIIEARRIAGRVLTQQNDDRKEYDDNRPAFLAKIRNKVLDPLSSEYDHVLFFNDIVFDTHDVLKLLNTRSGQYDMVCAMDFSYAKWQIYSDEHIDEEDEKGLRFYDTWVTRDVKGGLMTSRAPYVVHHTTQKLMLSGSPVPVYSCWNGVVAFPSALWVRYGLRFRAGDKKSECDASECSLWCRDMWKNGVGRIFINPLVRVAYDHAVFALARNEPIPTLGSTSVSDYQFSQPDSVVCCPTAMGSNVNWDGCYRQHESNVDKKSGLRVVFEGQLFEEHSYSLVNRELVNRLASDPEISVKAVMLDSDVKFRAKSRYRASDVNLVGESMTVETDVYVRNSWPPRWDRPAGCGSSCRFIMMLAWEFGAVPVEWLPHVDDMYLIIVPSNAVKNMFVRSGVAASKLHVLPHGVDYDTFNPGRLPYYGLGHKTSAFRFLSHGALLPRKGIDVMLEAFTLAFQRDDNVMLVLHTTYVHASDEYQQHITALVQEAITRGFTIQWLEGTHLTSRQVAGLYTSSDALVQPYRAEGYGLPIVEAMSSGLPVIVSKGGAADDYVSAKTAFLVNTHETTCKQWPCVGNTLCVFCNRDEECICKELAGDPYWLEPSVDHLAKQMRYVYEDSVERKRRAAAARRLIRGELSWDSVYRRLRRILRELPGHS